MSEQVEQANWQPAGLGPEDGPYFPPRKADQCPFDPPPGLRAIAGQPPARTRIWDGSTPWLVGNYADLREVLADERVSANAMARGFPHFDAAGKVRFQTAKTLLTMDPPEHTRVRSMFRSKFAVRRVEAMRPEVQAIVDRLIDVILSGPKPVDLVRSLLLPLPSAVIASLLGVPESDHGFFMEQTDVISARGIPAEAALGAVLALRAYLKELLLSKQENPVDDVLTELVTQHVATGEMSLDDAADMGVFLVASGYETAGNMMALGIAALLDNPEQLVLVRENSGNPQFVARAVEELLRYVPIVHYGRRRVAAADIEVNGQVIPEGDGIICAQDAANRDPLVFANPDKLDVTRDARGHVTFGFGAHQCMGQPLARVELQTVFSTLFRRIPTLRLTMPVSELKFKHDTLIYGLYELPVTW